MPTRPSNCSPPVLRPDVKLPRMTKSKRRAEHAKGRPDPREEPRPKSEEDLQPKDAGEMPREPQDPVQPPDRAS